MIAKSQILNVKPDPQPIGDMKLIVPTSSPTIGNTNVGRSAFHLDTQMSDFEGEVWKDIYGYEGMYQVSNKGRIKSCERIDALGRFWTARILKQWRGGCDQLLVTLCVDGIKNKVYVSHLVGGCFIGFPKSNEVYTHLDNNKKNNTVENIGIETKSSQMLLSYHNGVLKDWGIKNAGVKTRFVAKQKYVGTDKKGNKKEYTHNELHLKYANGVRSILRCIEGRESFNTAYGQTWEKLAL